MLNFLESKLYSDVEGTCSGQFGYIIAVVSILDIGKGMVLSGSGQAEFITKYRAIVFKPFKGEVVDGVVNNVNKVRLGGVSWDWAVDGTHGSYNVCSNMKTAGADGLFCGCWSVDGLRVASSTSRSIIYACISTISRSPFRHVQLINADMKFDPNSNPPSFASEDQASRMLFWRIALVIQH